MIRKSNYLHEIVYKQLNKQIRGRNYIITQILNVYSFTSFNLI